MSSVWPCHSNGCMQRSDHSRGVENEIDEPGQNKPLRGESQVVNLGWRRQFWGGCEAVNRKVRTSRRWRGTRCRAATMQIRRRRRGLDFRLVQLIVGRTVFGLPSFAGAFKAHGLHDHAAAGRDVRRFHAGTGPHNRECDHGSDCGHALEEGAKHNCTRSPVNWHQLPINR